MDVWERKIVDTWVDGESEPHDERNHTPWAEGGWSAWNGSSPEVEFAEAAGRLAAGKLVVETGAGQGYVTRRVAATARWVASYESWAELRDAIRPHAPANVTVPDLPTPTDDVVATADLCVFDSSRPWRLDEVRTWVEVGRGLCLVHDTGNGHQPNHNHSKMQAFLRSLPVAGHLYGNPRGCALLWKVRPDDDVLDLVDMPVLDRLTV